MSEQNPYAGNPFAPPAGQPNPAAQYPQQHASDPTAQIPPQQRYDGEYDAENYYDHREPRSSAMSSAEGKMWSQYCIGIFIAAVGAVIALVVVNSFAHLINGLFTSRTVPTGETSESVLWFTPDSAALIAFFSTILAGGLYAVIYKVLPPESRAGTWRGVQLAALCLAPLSVMVIAPLQPGVGPAIFEAISRLLVALAIVKGVAVMGKGLRTSGQTA